MDDDQRNASGAILDYRSARPEKPAGPRPPRVRTFGEELCKLAMLATLFVYYGLHGDRNKSIGLFFAAGWLIWATVIAAWVMSRVRAGRSSSSASSSSASATVASTITEPPPPRVGATWGAAIVAAFVASLLLHGMSLDYYACPHGQRWANPYVGLARSGNGGPCGNGPLPRGRHVWHVAGEWYLFVVR